MIVQWCIKGMHLPDNPTAARLIDDRMGIVSNWWRTAGKINPAQVRAKLSPHNVNMHVNHFTQIDPVTGKPFCEGTPFISLSAGGVERDVFARTNHVHTARRTALWFATQFGKKDYGYLYTCWVLLAPRMAAEVEALAEEVRDLNTYRRYSAYQTEGEVLAKIAVPDNQIQKCERWQLNASRTAYECVWDHPNMRFTDPHRLTNVRELI